MKQIVSNKKLMFIGMIALSAFSLMMAFIAQYVFILAPCSLCIIQRWPFVIVITLGIIGLLTLNKPKVAASLMGLIGITLISNAAIAFYHSGVERLWWKSMLEGCDAPELSGSADEILAQIQNIKEAVRCDEIPWADPLFGLSMANYNVAFCAGLGIIAFYSAIKYLKH